MYRLFLCTVCLFYFILLVDGLLGFLFAVLHANFRMTVMEAHSK